MAWHKVRDQNVRIAGYASFMIKGVIWNVQDVVILVGRGNKKYQMSAAARGIHAHTVQDRVCTIL
jgi:hypothetical protein